jgi:hypothetical protein
VTASSFVDLVAIVELVVHGGVIARSATSAGIDVTDTPPREAVVAAAVVLAELGVHRGTGLPCSLRSTGGAARWLLDAATATLARHA